MAGLLLNNIQVQDMNSFLREFRMTDFSDPVQIDLIKGVIRNAARALGAGAMGSVFNIPGSSDVVKVSNICAPGGANIVVELCNLSRQGDIVYKIPFTPTDKTLILAPNYISEALVGIILAKESPSFVNIKRFYFEREQPTPKIYVIMEKLNEMTPKVDNPESLIYLMLQIFQALSVGQSKFSFVHGDLHAGNILVRQYPDARSNIKCYEIGNGKYLYTSFDYDNVITDYGLSRCETKENILLPRLAVDSKAADFYTFNPYLDIFSFLVFLLHGLGVIRGPYRFNFPVALDRIMASDNILRVFRRFLGDSAITYDEIRRMIWPKETGWRCDPDKLFKSGKHLSNASDMFNVIANILELQQSGLGESGLADIPPPTDSRAVIDFLDRFKFYMCDSQVYFPPEIHVDFIGRVRSPDPYFFNINLQADPVGVDGVIAIQRHEQIPAGLQPYNRAVPQSMYYGMRLNNVVYLAMIDQQRAIDKGYSYRFDCCNVETRDYFKKTRFDSGIVINSVFFNIKGNKTPIGFYKTEDIMFDNPIPDAYTDYYAIAAINSSGRLVLDHYNNRTKYNQVLSCGAVLMDRGNPVFTPDSILQRDIHGKFLFLSETRAAGIADHTLTINGIQGIIGSVDEIRPGELKHGGNPNPRTILGTSQDGNTIYFIRIEGRDDRGPGMDFVEMGRLCRNFGIYNALNLDGGGSSRMCWKEPGENIITVAGTSLGAYPVGGVIALVKEKA